MANWLKNAKPCWTAELLSTIGKANKDNIVHIFQMKVYYYRGDVIPEACWDDPELFSILCTVRAADVDFDDEDFITKCVNKTTGKIEWKGYPVDLEWKDAKVQTICSYLGDKVDLKPHQVITQGFKIVHVADMMKATAKLDKIVHVLIDLFGKDSMVQKLIIDKKANCLKDKLHEAQSLQKKMNDDPKAVSATSTEISMVPDNEEAKEAKKRKAEKAREAVHNAKSKRVQELDLSKV